MGPDSGPDSLEVEVACSLAPRQVSVVQVVLPAGATVADALSASRLFGQPASMPQGLSVGVWGRRQPMEAVLRDGDRVEVCRALKVDPKEARRQRYKGQPPARTLRGADGLPKKQERPGRGRS